MSSDERSREEPASKKPAASWLKARAQMLEFALSLPGAWEDHPWEESVAKVGKKVFAFMGTDESHEHLLTVKLPQSGQAALLNDFCEPSGYGLGKSGWVSVKTPRGRIPVDMLTEWIEESYRVIAPKKLIAELDARG